MTTNANVSDQELFRQMHSEDSLPALNGLFERYWKKLYAAAYVRLKDEAEAKDCVQEIFIGLWQRRKQLAIPVSVSGYLYNAVKNRVINILHARLTREKYLARYLESSVDYQNDNVADMEAEELAAIVEDEIARMPGQMRTVYLLSRQEDMSGQDIAKRLDLSHQTVRNQITTALKRIRARLQQYQMQ